MSRTRENYKAISVVIIYALAEIRTAHLSNRVREVTAVSGTLWLSVIKHVPYLTECSVFDYEILKL
jgi:hypothetical protein